MNYIAPDLDLTDFIEDGIRRLERLLAVYAAFDTYLERHPRQ